MLFTCFFFRIQQGCNVELESDPRSCCPLTIARAHSMCIFRRPLTVSNDMVSSNFNIFFCQSRDIRLRCLNPMRRITFLSLLICAIPFLRACPCAYWQEQSLLASICTLRGRAARNIMPVSHPRVNILK